MLSARSMKHLLRVLAPSVLCILGALPALFAQSGGSVEVRWDKPIRELQTTATLQVVVNPMLRRGAKLHDHSFAALKELGADYVRYVPWLPYPKLGVAELEPPSNGHASWDFSLIDPMTEDFIKATEGHSVILNFSTIPAWMWKVDKPVEYPSDPDKPVWKYTQGSELRDASGAELGGYFARLLSWYTKGGFTDEAGVVHNSGHHYQIPYWEVLNEIDIEHKMTPEQYTERYDAIVAAMRKVDPNLKFMGLAMAFEDQPRMFEYFLDPSHHQPGTPVDWISYHFYAHPASTENIDTWQYTFFAQADGFLNSVRYIENLRKRLSPGTRTDLDEIGAILPEDSKEFSNPGYEAPAPPKKYWNLVSALYAYLYMNVAQQGIDVIGCSQLVGYHSQFPSVTMMNFDTGAPTARYWSLKLIRESFLPGAQLVETDAGTEDIAAQAFLNHGDKKVLVVNKRNRSIQVNLPAAANGAQLQTVDPKTGDSKWRTEKLNGQLLSLEPFSVTVVSYAAHE